MDDMAHIGLAIPAWEEASATGRASMIIDSGGIRVAPSVGALYALHQAGSPLPNRLYTTSSGVVVAAAYAAGDPLKALEWFKSLAETRVVDPRRWRRMLDIDGLRESLKRFSPLEFARRMPSTRILVGVSRNLTGAVEYHDLANTPDPIELVLASMARPMPGVPLVTLDSGTFFDGGTDSLPVEQVATDGARACLVLLNHGSPKRISLMEQLLAPVLARRLGLTARRRWTDRAATYNRARSSLLQGTAPGQVAWTVLQPEPLERPLALLSTDPLHLADVVTTATARTWAQFHAPSRDAITRMAETRREVFSVLGVRGG